MDEESETDESVMIDKLTNQLNNVTRALECATDSEHSSLQSTGIDSGRSTENYTQESMEPSCNFTVGSETMKRRNDTLSSKCEELKKEIKTLKDKIDGLEDDIEALNDEKEKLESDHKSEMKALKAENKKQSKMQIKEANETKERLEDEIEKLKEELEDKDNKIKDLKRTTQARNMRKSMSGTISSSLVEDFEKLKKEKDLATASVQELRSKNSRLEKDVHELKEQLKDKKSEGDYGDMESLTEKDDKIRELDNEIKELKNRHNAEIKEIKQKHEEELDAQKANSDRMESFEKKEEMEKKIEELSKQLEDMKTKHENDIEEKDKRRAIEIEMHKQEMEESRTAHEQEMKELEDQLQKGSRTSLAGIKVEIVNRPKETTAKPKKGATKVPYHEQLYNSVKSVLSNEILNEIKDVESVRSYLDTLFSDFKESDEFMKIQESELTYRRKHMERLVTEKKTMNKKNDEAEACIIKLVGYNCQLMEALENITTPGKGDSFIQPLPIYNGHDNYVGKFLKDDMTS